MRLICASVVFTALLSPAVTAPALAQPAGDNGRYQMTAAGSGFLRLDTRTGAVSVCTLTGAGAECRAAADDRAALMSEIERLTQRLAGQESGAPPAAARGGSGLPSKEEAGKAMDLAEEFMRRMMRIMRDETETRR